jgi:putative endonuclease
MCAVAPAIHAPCLEGMWKQVQTCWDRLRTPARTGDRGEGIAADWLCHERRFSIVARNWRSPRDRRQEIDLVCRDGEVLVFVEVKTRSPSALVPGYFAVDRRKKRVLLCAIRAYLDRLAIRPRTFRFDIVEVVLHASDGSGASTCGQVAEVMHFESIPIFPKSFW